MALLTRMEIAPNFAAACSQAANASARCATLAVTGAALPPAAAISAAADAATCSFISRTMTAAPSRANASQIARPMPRPPPVTNATCPSRRPVIATVPSHPSCGLNRYPGSGLIGERNGTGHIARQTDFIDVENYHLCEFLQKDEWRS